MNIATILTLAAVLYAAVMGLIYAWKARKKSWVMTTVRIGVTIFSAVVSIPLTKLLAELTADMAYHILRPYMGDGVVAFLDRVPVGAEGMRALAALLVSPALYLLTFFVLHGLLSLAAWIVEKCVPALRRRKLRSVSMPLGALNGVLIVVVTLVPLCGYLMFGAGLLGTASDAGMLDSILTQDTLPNVNEDSVNDLIWSVEENPVVVGVYGTVGRPIFLALTSTELDTSDTHGTMVEMNLERELNGLLVSVSHAMEVVESFQKEDYTVEDKELLYATADSLFASEWIRMLATDTLVALSESWLQDRPFVGMERPEMDETMEPIVNCLLEVLATETPETLEADIHVLLDMVGDLKVNHLLDTDADYTALVQQLGESGLLTDMLSKLENSGRLRSLADELKSLSVRLVSNMLGVEKLKSGEYLEMMGNVASSLTDALAMSEEEQDAWLLESIQTNFAGQGYDIPDNVAVKISRQMMEDLGADGDITAEELTDYLVRMADEGILIGSDQIPEDLPA